MLKHNRFSLWLLPLMGFLIGGSLLGPYQAAAAVELISFNASVLIGPAVQLDWETGAETDVVGYIIKRDSGSGPETIEVYFDNDLVTVIPAAGATVGAIYSVEDEDVEDLTTYTYYLFEIASNNSESQIAAITIFVDEDGEDDPTPFPIFTPTSIPGSRTNPPTSTPRPTATSANPTATVTTTSGGETGGQNATATPRPTIQQENTQPTPSASTNTGSSNSGSTGSSGSGSVGVPVAQAQEQEGYPGPGSGEAGVSNEEFTGSEIEVNPIEPVVIPDSTSSTGSQEQGYLAPDSSGTGNPAIQVDPSTTNGAQPIGQASLEENAAAANSGENSASQTRTEDATTGRWILWISFLGALLLFIGGVWMALLLFRRRQVQ